MEMIMKEKIKHLFPSKGNSAGSGLMALYRKEMAEPIEDMKKYLDGILHLYDEGRTKTRMPELFGMVEEAQRKFREASAEIAEHEGT